MPLISTRQVISCIIFMIIFFILPQKLLFANSILLVLVLNITFTPCIKYFLHYSSFTQKFLYDLPMFLIGLWGFIIFDTQSTNFFNINITLFALYFLFVLLLITLNIREIKQTMSCITTKLIIPKTRAIIDLLFFGYAVISEELFFRNTLLNALNSFKNIYTIFAISFIFVYVHYLNRWSPKLFNKKSYCEQFILSCILTSYIFCGGSIIGTTLLHAIYNIQQWLPMTTRLINSYKEVI